MANVKDLIVNGAARVIGKLYASEFVGNLTGNVTGNASTATKLESKINLTTTDGTNTSTAVSFDGSAATSIKLPTTIKATFSGNLTGNASTATTATNLNYFKNTSTTSIGLDNTDANGIGYVSGTNAILNQSDGALYRQVYSSSWVHEIYGDYRTGQIAVRGKNNNTWQAWRTILDSSNYTSWAASKNHNHSTDNITSGTLGIERGGTGLSSFTKGDIIYASNANVLSKLAKGTDGQVLKLSGGVPVWGTDNNSTNVSATTTGSGNAVTSVTASGSTITVTKGTTFLTSHQDISGKEDKSNKVKEWSAIPDNTNYPSEKLVKNALDKKADSTPSLHLISDNSAFRVDSSGNPIPDQAITIKVDKKYINEPTIWSNNKGMEIAENESKIIIKSSETTTISVPVSEPNKSPKFQDSVFVRSINELDSSSSSLNQFVVINTEGSPGSELTISGVYPNLSSEISQGEEQFNKGNIHLLGSDGISTVENSYIASKSIEDSSTNVPGIVLYKLGTNDVSDFFGSTTREKYIYLRYYISNRSNVDGLAIWSYWDTGVGFIPLRNNGEFASILFRAYDSFTEEELSSSTEIFVMHGITASYSPDKIGQSYSVTLTKPVVVPLSTETMNAFSSAGITDLDNIRAALDTLPYNENVLLDNAKYSSSTINPLINNIPFEFSVTAGGLTDSITINSITDTSEISTLEQKIETHKANKNNPHGVTAAQLGVSLSNGKITIESNSITPLTSSSVTTTAKTAGWGSEVIVGSIAGKDFKFTMPDNPTEDFDYRGRANTWSAVNTFSNGSNVTSASTTASGAIIASNGGIWAAGGIRGNKVYSAEGNDLADCIPVDDNCELIPGYCYCFDGENYYKSSKYLDDGIIGIHSDTYSMHMGYKDNYKQMDVAVSGFALAYVDKEYPVGTPLTCTENGYLTKIEKSDKIEWPEKIVATYWKNEPEEYWGNKENKIKVNGRKWVKVK